MYHPFNAVWILQRIIQTNLSAMMTVLTFLVLNLFSVVFMGSEKYPDENSFDLFIKNYGGSDNASTDCERVS